MPQTSARRTFWDEVGRNSVRVGVCLISAMITGLCALWAVSQAQPGTSHASASRVTCAIVAAVLVLVPLAVMGAWNYERIGRRTALAACVASIGGALVCGILAG